MTKYEIINLFKLIESSPPVVVEAQHQVNIIKNPTPRPEKPP